MILDIEYRKQVIGEIEMQENRERKAESLKRFEVYADNQRPYVLNMLKNEVSAEQLSEMRTCTSINLTKRVINAQASVYKKEPNRTFEPALSGNAEAQLKALYRSARVTESLKDANKKFKLHNQTAIQVTPSNGRIEVKALRPHHYDVIPDPLNPEEAYAYVLSGMDRWIVNTSRTSYTDIQGREPAGPNATLTSDSMDQTIADQNDGEWKVGKVYVFWTKDYHFRTDEDGNLLDEEISNPIGELPFIDVSAEKDLKFWAGEGSTAVDFNLDFSTVLSDTVNTNRLQGYAQAVITAPNAPENLSIGPQKVLFLKLDENRPETKPVFEFVSPSPDLAASLTLQDRLLSYFLTANGVDPKKVTGAGQAEKFSSGYERLLAALDEFEASQDDYAKFQYVEQHVLKLMIKWSNLLQGTDSLARELQQGVIDEELLVEPNFQGPEVVQTQSEKEDSIIKRKDAGLISRVRAYMEINGVSEDEARKDLAEIDNELVSLVQTNRKVDNNGNPRSVD